MNKILPLLFLLWLFSSCQSNVVEAGNPPTRPVQGTVPIARDEGCGADTAESTDTDNKTVTATIESDCSFEFTLTTEKLWSLTLKTNGTVVATTIFTPGFGQADSIYYFLTPGDAALDLGQISISGTTATPEIQPSQVSDQDGDGVADYNDGDDDNDGTADVLETDCDGDGIVDDLDLDSSC